MRDGAAAIAVEPDSAVVTIPDAHFLFTADFKRKGPDLVLTGEDGRKVLVTDYFRHEKQADLASPEGALLSADLVEILAGSRAPGQYAQDTQAGASPGPAPIGRVETLTGSASAVRNGVAIELNVGDLIFQGDVVQTRTDSTLAIAFSDGSAFTLNENARMVLNEFVYDPNSTSNSAVVNLVQGTVSFIAAQVAKTGNMRVETPTATMGISRHLRDRVGLVHRWPHRRIARIGDGCVGADVCWRVHLDQPDHRQPGHGEQRQQHVLRVADGNDR